MDIDEIASWIATSFLPLELVTPDETVELCIKNAIRYFNNYSAVRAFEMVSASAPRVQVSKYIKVVSQVYPDAGNTNTGLNLQDVPLWSLLGVQVVDAITSDMIMLSETYKTYRSYMGKDFSWTFVQSEDPSDANGGGYLYMQNLPSGCTRLCILGARRIFEDDNITNSFILDWILRYSRCLVKQIEGNSLRKADIIGVKNDGDTLVQEGKDEMKQLQEELLVNGRWLSFASRF